MFYGVYIVRSKDSNMHVVVEDHYSHEYTTEDQRTIGVIY